MNYAPNMEPTPDLEDVRQYEIPTMHTVPVTVDGYVLAIDLPAKRGVNRNFQVTSAAPMEIVPADPRIKRYHLFNSTASSSVYVGTLEQLMNTQSFIGYNILPSIPYPPFEGCDERLYAISTATTATISVRIEYWAD
jgi:hypothetical protein